MKYPNVQIETATVRGQPTVRTVPARGEIVGQSHRVRPDAPLASDRAMSVPKVHQDAPYKSDAPSASDGATLETVAQLRAKLERYRESRGGRGRRAGWARRFVASGLAPLDDVLPGGGVPRGGVTEILSDTPGVGAMTIAMRIALRSSVDEMHRLQTGSTQGEFRIANEKCRMKRNRDISTFYRFIVFVDTVGDFYPPAAWGVGIDPARLIVVRPGSARDAFWVVDQCLRCPGVAAVVAPLSKLDQLQSRRMQLAAEDSGAVGLILRPARQAEHSFASVRMLVEGVPTSDIEQLALAADRSEMVLCRVTLLSVREGNPAGPVLMDLNHVTGACDLYSVPVDRPVARVG